MRTATARWAPAAASARPIRSIAARSARVRAERDFVARELGAALGRGGRPRTLATDVERARISVTRAVRAAIDRIGQVDAAAGAHLAVAVRTGALCSYHPERTELR